MNLNVANHQIAKSLISRKVLKGKQEPIEKEPELKVDIGVPESIPEEPIANNNSLKSFLDAYYTPLVVVNRKPATSSPKTAQDYVDKFNKNLDLGVLIEAKNAGFNISVEQNGDALEVYIDGIGCATMQISALSDEQIQKLKELGFDICNRNDVHIKIDEIINNNHDAFKEYYTNKGGIRDFDKDIIPLIRGAAHSKCSEDGVVQFLLTEADVVNNTYEFMDSVLATENIYDNTDKAHNGIDYLLEKNKNVLQAYYTDKLGSFTNTDIYNFNSQVFAKINAVIHNSISGDGPFTFTEADIVNQAKAIIDTIVKYESQGVQTFIKPNLAGLSESEVEKYFTEENGLYVFNTTAINKDFGKSVSTIAELKQVIADANAEMHRQIDTILGNNRVTLQTYYTDKLGSSTDADIYKFNSQIFGKISTVIHYSKLGDGPFTHAEADIVNQAKAIIDTIVKYESQGVQTFTKPNLAGLSESEVEKYFTEENGLYVFNTTAINKDFGKSVSTIAELKQVIENANAEVHRQIDTILGDNKVALQAYYTDKLGSSTDADIYNFNSQVFGNISKVIHESYNSKPFEIKNEVVVSKAKEYIDEYISNK